MLRFLLPSIFGALAFLAPVRHEGVITIPMAVLSDWLTGLLGSALPGIVVAIVCISAVLTLWYSTRRARGFEHSNRLQQIFVVSRGWLLLRVLGGVVTVLIFFQVGPEFI